jgi:hypothetical protein
MNSPASLATAIQDRLEDELPSVRAWLAELAAAADLDREAAAQVDRLDAALTSVELGAAALATACGKLPA